MNADDENHQLMQYKPLVEGIARSLIRRLPSSVDMADLIQEGCIGLMAANKKYKTGFNATFETYASHRIRGAMLDYLRQNDPLTRHSRESGESAAHLSFETEDELNSLLLSDDRHSVDALGSLLIREQEGLLSEAINKLDERERRIIETRFLKDERQQKRLAEDLTVSTSFVRQLEKRALKKLARLLEETQ